MKHGKKYLAASSKVSKTETYSLDKAIALVKELKFAKFDETVEVHVRVKLDKGQTLRDTVVLPHQFRGEKKILVFCTEDRVNEALDAGATYAGSTEYIDKVKDGWLDFDVAVATPDMMRDVGRLGMVLGRRGLMPNPKTGTVSTDITATINELKKGRVEFRADKTGVVHLAVGKVSMDDAKIVENISAVIAEINRKKPSEAKAGFVQSVSVSSTMGPGVRVNHTVGE
ncbi:MAG: 50S ribosomal protein L1 [Spirochaetaceae bacterium]|nr:50S ribosomal protein L1 [Spirochaetaceae bacterium]